MEGPPAELLVLLLRDRGATALQQYALQHYSDTIAVALPSATAVAFSCCRNCRTVTYAQVSVKHLVLHEYVFIRTVRALCLVGVQVYNYSWYSNFKHDCTLLRNAQMKEAFTKQLANKDYQRFLSKVPRVEGVWDDHDYGGASERPPCICDSLLLKFWWRCEPTVRPWAGLWNSSKV